MSIHGDQYILEAGRSGHDRLRAISEIHDGRTRELLLQAGLGPGHRFVEFGCGLGYVSRWAAGIGATATGIDLSADQVAESARLAEGMANVDFRQASIYEHGLEPGSVDVSYSRWLLVHLKQPVMAMQRIYEALKPGGVMVCEETDVSALYTEPASAAYHELRDLGLAAGVRRGVDYTGGRRAHRWAKDAGFEVVHVSAYHPHYVTDPHKGFWSWSLEEAGGGLVKEGTLSAERLQELVHGMRAADRDPEVLVAHSRMHQLIARKPS